MTTREAPQDVIETVATARALEHDSRELSKRAADMIREAADTLYRQGWNQNQIAAALGVSRQRVSQLFNPEQARLQRVRRKTADRALRELVKPPAGKKK